MKAVKQWFKLSNYDVLLAITVSDLKKELVTRSALAEHDYILELDTRLMVTMWYGRCCSCLPACWLISVVLEVKYFLALMRRYLHRTPIILSRPKNTKHNPKLVMMLL